MTYTKQQWANEETVGHAAAITTPYGPVDATRLGVIEQGTYDAHASRPADYVIYQAGGVYYAKSPLGTDYSGSDAAAVCQSAITALGTGGGTIVLRGALAWGSVPAIPKNITGQLVIRGTGSTVVTLSAAGPRFLDLNKTADYDTFQNIEIRDLVIDGGNVGGKSHVVIGSYVAGVFTARINIDRITIENVRTTNVRVDATGTDDRRNVFFFVNQPTAGETQCNITNIRVVGCDFKGGSYGVGVGGNGISTVGLTVWIDEILIERCRHSGVTVAPNFFAGTNFHVGSRGYGGRVTIRDCYGEFSGDDGVEINAMQEALIDNVTIVDAWGGELLHTNFNNPPNPNRQRVVFANCKVIRSTSTNTAWSGAYILRNNLSVALGTVEFQNCSLYKNANVVSTAAGQGEFLNAAINALTIRKIVVRGCHTVTESFNYTAVGAVSPASLAFTFATSGNAILDIDDCYISFAGQRSGGGPPGALTWTGISIAGNCTVRASRVVFNYVVTTSSANMRCWDIGATTSTISGLIEKNTIIAMTDDANPRFAIVRGTATLTIPKSLRFEGNDWQNGPAGITEILYTGTSNAAGTFVSGNKWKNQPAPTTLTGLVTATGKVLATGYSCLVNVRQGTGAAITAIDFSTNSGTTYTNFLTQASAAIPGGFCQSMGVLTTDALIKATFTTTQPTFDLTPFNP